MAAFFGGYWTNLASTGSPNSGRTKGLIAWPLYDPSKDEILILDDPLATTVGLQADVCDFWDTVAERVK
jgi:carboxylesterase type B